MNYKIKNNESYVKFQYISVFNFNSIIFIFFNFLFFQRDLKRAPPNLPKTIYSNFYFIHNLVLADGLAWFRAVLTRNQDKPFR